MVLPAGSGVVMQRTGRYRKLTRPYSIPIEAYRRLDSSPISDAAVSGVIPASGLLTLQSGPSGLGTRWYPAMATVSTTVGANDTSTVSVYMGTLGLASAQAAQSYAGGGDTAGLNSVELYPGLYVVASWTGGTPGSTATLVVYGDQLALV